MFTPQQDPHLYQHQKQPLAQTFSILCWNVHKENMHPRFHVQLHQLLLKYPSDFLLFQEYKMPKHLPHGLKDFSYAMAANMETKRHIYGLITGSNFSFNSRHIELTHTKELLFSTKKSMLLTSHPFTDGGTVHILNMHGINFVSLKAFSKELAKIESVLEKCEGMMIVSGDFNNWSKRRIEALEKFRQTLCLEKALVQQDHHIKRVFAKPIDHIFYRGLKLVRAEAIDTKKVSDHNPIHAVFKRF
jgi:endonuclease/exonuclease/phosphatase (EEP) superfamily protein YafD